MQFRDMRLPAAMLAFLVGAFLCIATSSTANAACDGNFCDTEAEAQALSLSKCTAWNPANGSPAAYKSTTLHSTSYNGVVYDGWYSTQVGGRDMYGCTTYTPNSLPTYWRRDALPNPCADKQGQSFTGWGASWVWPPSGSTCNAGCSQTETVSSAPIVTNGTRNGAPAKLYNYYGTATYTGETCTTDPDGDNPSIEDDPGEDLGDGWKCDPTTGLCEDPDGNGKLCTFNPDGSRSACVDHKPGDGTDPAPPDEEEPNDPRDKKTSTGGGSCDAAPACSGDEIGCATLWQQWKTRCEVVASRATISGSNAVCSQALSTGYACIGDAAACRTLNDTHAIRCAAEALASACGGVDPFDKAGERADLDAAGQGGDGSETFNPSAFWNSPGQSGPGISDSLFGGGGGCPTFPAITVGGSTFTAPPEFCGLVEMLRFLFIAVAYIWALRIVGE